MARVKTNLTGVYYRTSTTNGKEDKTYYITFYDNDSKKKELKIGKYSEGVREAYCNQKRNEIITKLRLGEEPPVASKHKKKNKVLLADIADKYFKNRKEGKSKESDIATFNKHLKDYFTDLETVTKSDIEKLISTLEQKRNISGNTLSKQTVKNILGILSAVVNFGLKDNLLKNNITKYYKRTGVDNARQSYLSKSDIKALYERLEIEEEFYLMFVKLSLNTGGRAATIMNIKKKDINFNHNTITLKDFKNDSTYTGFFNDELKALLLRYTQNLKLNDSLFTLGQTTLLRNLGNILNELFNIGIDRDDRKNKVVVHTLRHTFASYLAINGTPIFTIQKLMNHKDISTTMRYAKLAPDSGKESVVALGF
ncbi:MAG: site-specific integrase [Sulfurimonas sp.]|uniref:tyrosine-type recombinase/integrase n=1 Tax=Sulfurimonas sp. TaxID=2022749 RepID=UPI00262B04BD|nr:site-specific integrase [Sulfurimonas sp.]MDD2653021.1 site-specific integrase [Sulfurimonas sp.]MDD3452467.1 site-specific integrase [Sulfurimonas sp.]